mmetsp:Transcript_7113/g.13166  ORF Transcript_7113/g.13166 Transcript_7113/m.13166 type:complete len:132 (+) Transcript_7113:3-398(+)
MIKENAIYGLSLMEDGSKEADDGITNCKRGLEPFTLEGRTARNRRRKDAMDAVLSEQICSPGNTERISEVYQSHTIVSTTIAKVFGLIDARGDSSVTSAAKLVSSPGLTAIPTATEMDQPCLRVEFSSRAA